MKRKKSIEVYKDGQLVGRFDSIIEAIYAIHVSYHSIKKSIETGAYIRGYTFRYWGRR